MLQPQVLVSRVLVPVAIHTKDFSFSFLVKPLTAPRSDHIFTCLIDLSQVLEYERDYMCAKCRHVFTVQADFDQFYSFVSPAVCPNPEGCNSFKFNCLSGESEPATCRDYQEIKIQEQVWK